MMTLALAASSLKHKAEIALSPYKRADFAVDPKDPEHIAA